MANLDLGFSAEGLSFSAQEYRVGCMVWFPISKVAERSKRIPEQMDMTSNVEIRCKVTGTDLLVLVRIYLCEISDRLFGSLQTTETQR